MNAAAELRLLQAAVAIACLVPLAAGGAGVLLGPGFLSGVEPPVPPDLASHFRYLSGLLFAIGIGFLSCIPRIEAKTTRFRLLGALVVAGGVARALSVWELGLPSAGHRFGLVMELLVVPLLLLWQARIARRVSVQPGQRNSSRVSPSGSPDGR